MNAAKKFINKAIEQCNNSILYHSFIPYEEGANRITLIHYMNEHKKKFISLGRGYYYCPKLGHSPVVFHFEESCMYMLSELAMKDANERLIKFTNKVKETINY